MTAPVHRPDTPSATYRALEPKWQRCRDVRGGTDVFREKATTYLPRFLAEADKDWATRVSQTFVTSYLDQAIGMSVGLISKHDPELGAEVPAILKADWENLDGQGNHGAVVTQMAQDQALQDGHVILLTDAPPEQAARADEEAATWRPYVVRVGVDDILSWRTAVIGGRLTLLQLVIRERALEADGTFGERTATRYKVFRQAWATGADAAGVAFTDYTKPYVQWERWEEVRSPTGEVTDLTLAAHGDLGRFRADGSRLSGPSQIPVAVIYGGKPTGILTSRPPLEDIAFANIRWAQVESERAATLHKAGIIMLAVTGELQGAPETGKAAGAAGVLRITQGGGIHLKAGGSAEWIEPQGTALDQQFKEREAIEKRIAGMALAILKEDPIAPATATESRREQAKEESLLARLVRSTKDALEQTLIYLAEFRGLPTTSLSVTLPRDFATFISTEDLRLASELEEKGQLTMATLLQMVARSGRFGDGFDPAAEAEALAQEAVTEPPAPTDPSTMTDEELEAEFTALERQRAERLARRGAA